MSWPKRLELRRIAGSLALSAAVWASASLPIPPSVCSQDSYRARRAETRHASYQQVEARENGNEKWTPPLIEARSKAQRQREASWADEGEFAGESPGSARTDSTESDDGFVPPFDAPREVRDGERRTLNGFVLGCLTCIALFATWRLLCRPAPVESMTSSDDLGSADSRPLPAAAPRIQTRQMKRSSTNGAPVSQAPPASGDDMFARIRDENMRLRAASQSDFNI